MKKFKKIALVVFSLFLSFPIMAQPMMESLDRGLVAIKKDDNNVFLSWRLLANDPTGIMFNVYRIVGDKAAVKLNAEPLTKGTNFQDTDVPVKQKVAYFVEDVVKGKGTSRSKLVVFEPDAVAKLYMSLPLKQIPGYTPNDASVGDLDGDGEYEIILHQAGIAKDNSHDGFTDEPILQAYKLDGTLLWEINLGKNIREGAHYTQFIVMDFDGDGKAEIACKTADGTIDGVGKVIGDSTKDWRNPQGRILDGPEFLTVFNGETGEAMATVDYIPNRYPVDSWGSRSHNDTRGNRSDRFLATAAYLDGNLPSLVMARGYYSRSVLAAWDYKKGKLVQRWVFDSENADNPFSGQGNHNLTAADIDGDGKDEIVYGAMVVDHDGKGLYSTGFGHGDALHVGDLIPSRPGLEIFGIHENPRQGRPSASLRDAKTGYVIWKDTSGIDVGRGVAANIDPDSPGAEMWYSGSRGLLNYKGERIGPQPPSANFLIWWDGDLTRELLNSNTIDKYKGGRLLTADGSRSINGTKSTPVLSGDIFGDWREEVIFRSEDNSELRIYTTTHLTDYRLVTLMHDPQYRLSIAWQNVAYNQPPHTSFYIGEDMDFNRKPVKVTINEIKLNPKN